MNTKTKDKLSIHEMIAIVMLLAYVLFSTCSFAQNDSATIIRKNVIGFFIPNERGFGLKYELMQNRRVSLGAHASFKVIAFPDVPSTHQDFYKCQSYAFTPFIRYYQGHKKTMPSKWYLQGNVNFNYVHDWEVTYGGGIHTNGNFLTPRPQYYPEYSETHSFFSFGLGGAFGYQLLIKKRISIDANIGYKWVPFPPWVPQTKTVDGQSYPIMAQTSSNVFNQWNWKGRGHPGSPLFIQWSIGYAF